MAAPSKSRTSPAQIERWRKIVDDCHASELTCAAFCKKMGISKSTLGYWRRKFEKELAITPKQTIVPVSLPPTHGQKPVAPGTAPVTTQCHMLLQVTQQFCIQIHDDFSSVALEKLLRTLERVA